MSGGFCLVAFLDLVLMLVGCFFIILLISLPINVVNAC